MPDVLVKEHVCNWFMLGPYSHVRIARCSECGKRHDGASEMAERGYHWGLMIGKQSKEAEIRKALGL